MEVALLQLVFFEGRLEPNGYRLAMTKQEWQYFSRLKRAIARLGAAWLRKIPT